MTDAEDLKKHQRKEAKIGAIGIIYWTAFSIMCIVGLYYVRKSLSKIGRPI